MLSTSFTDLFDLRVPIQSVGIPGIATPQLVAAVTNAGALGMGSASLLEPGQLAALLDEFEQVCRGPYGVNFLMPFLDLASVDLAAARAPLVEFFYGDPDPSLVARVHRGGARVSWQVGTLEEAGAAAAAGCDFIIVQGTEAGGHIRAQSELSPLLEAVLEAVDVPVLAAGGIATAGAVASALRAGAAGVRVGTRLLASHESGAHPDYIAGLLGARAEDTCITEAFSGMWPHAPHRVLRSAIAAAEAASEEEIGQFPIGDQQIPVPRFSVIAPTRGTTGNIKAMALYAGESVNDIESVESVADIIAELSRGAEQVLDD